MRSFTIALVAAVIGITTVFLAVARAAEPTKTLEEIAIEGEVRLPEVLFITSRDVQRPIDWLEEYLLEEETAATRLDQAQARLLVFPDTAPVPGTESENLGGESVAPGREIEEENR
jgi:hypothetical protein